MWISKKVSGEALGGGDCAVGLVTIGGVSPCVLTEGEARNGEIVSCGGALRLPKTGEQVLLARSADGESLVIGRVDGAVPEGMAPGEVYITTGGSSFIRLKNSGEIELSGPVSLRGRVDVFGSLYINGVQVVAGNSGGGGSGGA
ncbi:MAG: hypothetical protein RR731_01105 [Oscillospiraceae bacterium]